MCCNEPNSASDLEQALQLAEANDWQKLVATIRNIMSGNRGRTLLQNLDEEETIIIESILNGIDDPATLPAVTADLNSDMAASGIASLIHASMQGNTESANVIDSLTTQMSNTGSEYATIAVSIKKMIEGERNLEILIENISEQGHNLMTDILTELKTLETQE